jgi:D-alanyl-D-alanine carboxypeptidase/D-alanyl-D-alanine-endopeptidase (penicillin-binding protein 4)
MYKKLIIISLILAFLLPGCITRYIKQEQLIPVASERLANQINLLIDAPEFQTTTIGLLVQSLDTGEILYRRNAEKVLIPASNEKIPTSSVALMKFGPDFCYQTNLYTNGVIEDGVLKGDLIVVGSGDPTISRRFCDDTDKCLIFMDWISALVGLNIKEVQGNLIGIDDIFDDEPVRYRRRDNQSYYYSAQISGLMLNENSAEVTLRFDPTSHDFKLSVIPDYGYLNFQADISIIDDNKGETRIEMLRETDSNLVTFSGAMKVDDEITRHITVPNPTLYFLYGLAHELSTSGVAVTGQLIDSDDLDSPINIDDLQLLYTHFSPKFSEVLKALLKNSINLYADSFVKLLGYHFGKGGNFEEGEKVIKETLLPFGLEDDSYQYTDGSGLSRSNFISPAQIVKILRGMHYHKYGKIFRECLPLAGIDGTIGSRMKGTSAEGKIYAKTGTISNVRCLSGYVTTKDGENLVFSFLANNFLCSVQVVMDLQDQICIALSSFSRD